MKPFFPLLVVCYVFGLQGISAAPKTDTVYLTSETIGKHLINDKSFNMKVTGKHDNLFLWRYNPADNSGFAAKDLNDSSWPKRDPQFYTKEINEGQVGNGPAWFRLRIQAEKAVVGTSLCFQLEGNGAIEVYLDGKLKSRAGSFDTNGKHDYFNLNTQPLFLSFPDTEVHVLAVRYENNDVKRNEEYRWGFNLNVDRADNFLGKMRRAYVMVSWVLISIGTIFLTQFVIHLLMYLFYRREYSNFYFALFTLSLAVMLYYTYIIFVSDRPKEYSTFAAVVLSVTCIVAPTSLSAFIAVLFSKKKIVLKGMVGLGTLTLIISLIDLENKYELTGILIYVLLLLSIGYALVMIVVAMIRRIPGAFLLGSGIIFFLTFTIGVTIWGTVAKSLTFNNTLILLALASAVSIPLSISAFLAWRFAFITKNLNKQLAAVETLSQEKQSILENQNAHLENEVAVRTQEIAEEKRRSDNLLLNILPQEVAEELKLHGHSKAQRYDQVSVLFTDFVNFTRISEQLGVEELLNELNINFTNFDRIMEKHGLEKIKTIGDAYLAVCGVPAANERHAQNTVNAALEILEYVKKRKQEVPYGLDIRIGINSGSLIAGIIGVKKFAYDIWGDTVNTAARMEQNSEPGKINISESTYSLVKEEFTCAHRGKVDAKGKGEIDMYFVERR